jgi:hypothetical protein
MARSDHTDTDRKANRSAERRRRETVTVDVERDDDGEDVVEQAPSARAAS